MRSGILVRRKLLNTAVSVAAVALQSSSRALLPSDGRRYLDAPLGNISPLPVCPGSLDALSAIAGETCAILRKSASNHPQLERRGAFEVAHLTQVAASAVLGVHDVLATATRASECARFGQAGAKQVWISTAARRLKNYAMDFEAEPEEEFAVQAH